jgi:hypothetical protein
MRETLINSVLTDEKMKGSEANVRRENLRMAWEIFVNNPTDTYFKEFPDLQEDLMVLQEKLASSFEAYLTKEKAPHGDLVPIFKSFRSTLLSYYKSVNQKVPRQYRRIHPDLATAFDKMLVDVPLARDRHAKVILTNKEGEKITYTLHRSRPQEEQLRNVLQYLNRANSAGLHDQLINYAGLMEVDLTPERLNQIRLVQGKAEGLALIKSIDEAYIQKQERVRLDRVKEVRSLIKQLESKTGIDPEIQELARGILSEIDTKVRSEKRIGNILKTISHLNERYAGALDLPLPSLVDLREVLAMNKKSLDNMSEQELLRIRDSLDDLLRYNLVTIEAFKDKQLEELEADVKQFVFENNGNHWYTKNQDKNVRKVSGWDIIGKYNAFRFNNIRALSAFSQRVGDMFSQSVSNLIEGKNVERHLSTTWRKAWSAIHSKTFKAGVTREFGPIKDSDMVSVDMLDERGHSVPQKFTIGQIMIWYGGSFNEKMYDSYTEGGIHVRETGKYLKFTSKEAYENLIETLLTEEQKKAVRDTIGLFEQVHPVLSEAFFENTGVHLAKEKNFLPSSYVDISRSGKEDFLLKPLGSIGEEWYRKRLHDMTFLRPRIGGMAPQYDVDFFAVCSQTLEDIAKYVGMSKPIHFARTRMLFGDLRMDTPSYQIQKMMGAEKFQALKNWFVRLEDDSRRENSFINVLGKVAQNVRTSIMLWAPSMAALQPLAILGALNYKIDVRDIMKAMAGGILKGPRIMTRLSEVSEMMEDRFHRVPAVYQDATSQSHQTRRFTLKAPSYFEEFAKIRTWRDFRAAAHRVDQSGTFALVYLDAYALSVIYDAVQNTGKRKGWTEQEMKDRFELIVNRTQAVNDPLFTSNFLSEKSTMARIMMVVFQTQLDSFRGERQTNWMELRNLANGAEKKEDQSAFDRVNNILRIQITLPLAAAIVQETWASLGKDEDEEEIPFFGRLAIRTINNMLSMEAFIGDPITMVINGLTYGYWGTQNLLLSPLVSATKHASRGISSLGEDDDKAMEEFSFMATELTRYKGIALANIAKVSKKIADIME